MALYTRLTRTEITALMRSFGLGPPQKVKGILDGTVNTYYELNYTSGNYFLKVDEVGDRLRLKRELGILRLLKGVQGKLGFRIPLPLPTVKGLSHVPFHGKFILLFKKLPGRSYFGNDLTLARMRAIGSALASLHRAAPARPLAPHRFCLKEQCRVYRQILPALQAKHPAIARKMVPWLRWLKKNEPVRIPSGLIHADLFPENILFQGGKIAAILDFEAAGRGPFLFDICVAIHACAHDGGQFVVAKAKALLRAYEEVCPLGRAERERLEYYLHQSCMRFLLTRLRDFELKDGRVLAKPFKDYREYLNRFGEIPTLAPYLV